MNKREDLNKLRKKEKIIILEKNIYILSTLLLLNTITINFLNIINEPYLINGVILEINILIIFFCIYTIIKKQQEILIYKNKIINHKQTFRKEKQIKK